MKKSNLLNSLILAALAVPGMAMAADAPSVTSNIGLVSNYLYRGISQTGGKAALQGGFDFAHASGFYAGLWGSNVSWVPASSASLELDTYAGFKGSFASDFSYDVGYLRYNYTGVYAEPLPVGTAKADTDEVYAALGWKWVTLKYSHSLGDTFGWDDASGTSYVELNASYSLADSGVTLGAHYGKQTFKGTAADAAKNTFTAGVSQDPTYSDYKLYVNKDVGGYVFGLAYSATDAETGGIYTATQADGTKTDLGKGTFVLSLTHAM